MGDVSLANRYRPTKFGEVVGQKSEVRVIKTILEKGWKPNVVMMMGPFGAGKTTLARLLARALLCENRGEDLEPCGTCASCKAMDKDNHPGYTELDAASNGSVTDVRGMIDQLSYQVTGASYRIICYDESHMLSNQAQNALLTTLEEGLPNTMYIFATTDAQKMLPTIVSRSIKLTVKLLTAAEISARLEQVAKQEGIELDPKAARIIATYVRGHMRDAMQLLDQCSKMEGKVSEELVRTYLRLDKYDDVYGLLLLKEQKAILEKLEDLLCNYAPGELSSIAADIMVNAFKLHHGAGSFTQVDAGWLHKVLEVRDANTLLETAYRILQVDLGYATITQAIVTFTRALAGESTGETSGAMRSLRPAVEATPAIPPSVMRKQKV